MVLRWASDNNSSFLFEQSENKKNILMIGFMVYASCIDLTCTLDKLLHRLLIRLVTVKKKNTLKYIIPLGAVKFKSSFLPGTAAATPYRSNGRDRGK